MFILFNFLCFCKITTTFRGHFDGDKPDRSRQTCISLLEGSSSRSFLLPASSVQCSDNTQAMVTVYSMGNTEIGNKCNEKLLLSYEFGDICGKCLFNGMDFFKNNQIAF